MEPGLMVECLSCGQLRSSGKQECPRCRYVGWALSDELTERVRRLLRERPLPRRRLYTVLTTSRL